MIYPIGHTSLAMRFERALNSALRVDDVEVCGPDRWIDVPMSEAAMSHGAPTVITLRLRVEPTPGARWFLIAEEILAGPTRFDSLYDLMNSEARAWLPLLGPLLDAEIARRVATGQRAHSGPHTTSRGSVPGTDASNGSDGGREPEG